MATREHPIIFSGPMVRAILAGRKTQTRRVVKPQPENVAKMGPRTRKYAVGDRLWVKEAWRVGAWWEDTGEVCVDYRADGYSRREWLDVPDEEMFARLWIQSCEDAKKAGFEYDADHQYNWKPGEAPTRWRPSIFMPRWASRLTLPVIGVRCERLRDISEADAVAEGVGHGWKGSWPDYGSLHRQGEVMVAERTQDTARMSFATLWDTLNAKRGFGWEANPWVVVIEWPRVVGEQEGGEAK